MSYLPTVTVDPHARIITVRDNGFVMMTRPDGTRTAFLDLGDDSFEIQTDDDNEPVWISPSLDQLGTAALARAASTEPSPRRVRS